MRCEQCERLRDRQATTHRSYMEHIGDDSRESQNTDTPNGLLPLREAYDAAAAEYKGHLATEHPLPPPRFR